MVFGTQKDPKRNRSESALIRNLGGGSIGARFHACMIQRMPQLKMADSAILQEKSIISPRNVADNEDPPSRNLEKNLSRDIKHLFEDFSRTRPDLLSFLFSTNYFSTPPRGYVQTKKSFTLSALSPNWRREWDSNPRGRDAQRLSCQSTNIQRGSRGRRFNHSAIPAQQSTKTGTSLKPFQSLAELSDQREPEDTILWTKDSRPSRLGSSR